MTKTITSLAIHSCTFALLVAPVALQAACSDTTLCNPLKYDSLTQFLNAIMSVLIKNVAPVIAFFAIIYAGFKFVMAQGNPNDVKAARDTITWTVVGLLILFGAQFILALISGTVQQVYGGF